MKKKFILYPVVGLLLYIILSSYSEGPAYWGNVDGTGATNPGGCSCHGPSGASSPTTAVALELDSAGIPVTHYTGGHVYTIKITGTNSTGLTWFGFQMCVIKTGTSGGSAVNEGSFATSGLPSSTHFVPSGTAGVVGGSGLPVAFVEHSAPINSASPYIESFSWTAPAAGTGSITIYGAINAVDDDSRADATDLWNNNNVTICENVSSITGTLTVCTGATTSLADATTGGTWSSSSTTVATVTSGGTVTGVSGGTAIISYNAGCSGIARATVTVNTSSPISGTLSVCQGSTTGLTDGTGTWASNASSIATVGATGIVTGVITGSTGAATASITFTPSTGCPATSIVTVNPLPAVITGTTSVCQGATTALTETTTGGTWSSSSTGIATVNSSGIVAGVLTGGISPATSTITYTSSSGCTRATIVTVNPLPASITGVASVCQGATLVLGETTTGGTWSSAGTGITTVSSSGVITGVVTGSSGTATALVTYTTSTGCSTTATVTVNASVPAISGATAICAGASTTLSDASTGGTWSSGITAVASIGLSSGVLFGGPSPGGTTIVTYTSLTGCSVTTIITVNPNPPAIFGTTSICAGATTTLTDALTGGTWSSSSTTVGTIGLASGLLTGGSNPGGTTTISYIVNGCSNSIGIIVNPSPPAITGTSTICGGGSTTTLTDAITGGTWISGNISVGTILLSSGFFTANAGPGGTSVITYTAGTGCTVTTTVTVNPLPAAITGTLALCPGTSSLLNDATTGGTWSSSTTTNATITAGGSVTGAGTGGTSVISYTAPIAIGGCTVTATVTVNSSPPAISGITSICSGGTTILNDATTGGTWSSNNTTVASVGLTSGLLTGGSGAGGTATITYTPPTGCTVTITVTINSLPPGITGIFAICSGTTTTLTDAVTGGTWNSSNTAASIGIANGIVTGAAGPGGTAIITYTTLSGCTTSAALTVNPLPSSITGATNVCSGASTVLNDATTGGTWSSSNTGVATVAPGAGSVNGIGTGGTATITYALSTGCGVSTIVTVNPPPPNIGGTMSICVGLTSLLSDATSGGTWSSGNTAVATVITATGVVTGVSPNTASVTYTSPTGCITNTTMTVNPLPSLISGTLTVCAGLTSSLGNTTTGGTWTSSNTSVASVGLSSGTVTGATPGTATITYTVGVGCTSSAVVTINPLSSITGPTSLCTGTTATLADATTGGTWSSGSTGIGTVIATTGIVTAVAPGNTIITYTLPTGCAASATVSVVSTPSVITGTMNVCAGSSTALTDLGGGTWTSSNTAVATVIRGSGNVFGISNGTTIITYSLGTSCNAITTVTVDSLPRTITGITHACIGSTTALSDGGGGTWSSGAPGIATVDAATGTVTGVAASTSIITYTLGTGCISTIIITINSLPASISGTTNICVGSTTSLGGSGGGTWSSSSTGTATVSGTGVVSGVAIGTSTIAYTLTATGCAATTVVTVNSLPPSITGASTVCMGATTTMADVSSGGIWSSSATSTATVGSGSGIISGVVSGPVTINYSLGAGCTVSKIISVDPLPSGIAGSVTVCAGASITLSDGSTGGTWASSNTSLATVLPTSSSVTGVSAGVDTIFYRVTSTGCSRGLTITVNPVPGTISGTTNICLGSTSALTDGSTGGTWSSSATFVAGVGLSTGIVTSLSSGPATITYKLPTGCLTTSIVTVNTAPSAIAGLAIVCAGSSTILTDATTGGTWSSSNTSIATVPLGAGATTGIVPGIATITYTALTGCITGVVVTINPSPSAISGASSVCSGSTTTLTDGITGGTWSSSATTVATIGFTTGIITGGTVAGPATITYRLPLGCSATTLVSTNSLPSAISGTTTVCTGATTSLIDITSSGTWSSSNTGVATTSAAGIVSGIISGTTTIAYTSATGCSRTINVTVNPVPSAITGTMVVCAGSATTLGDGMTGGTWSSGTTSVATSTLSSGSITGVLAGTAIINYTLAGCSTTTIFTVNPVPLAITGTTTLCAGSTTTLIDMTTSGTWSSGGTSTATIGSSGIVTAVSAGIVTISYTIGTGCAATQSVTINATPPAPTGTETVCTGLTTRLTDGATGGTWSSGSIGIATAISATGVITGILAGTSVITYTLPTGCTTTAAITVNTAPSPLAGTAEVCQGDATVLTDVITGGTWLSGSTGTATVSTSGTVTGIASGTAVITYTLVSGCSTEEIITVNPSPSAITGTLNVCAGSSTALGGPSGSGSWSSSSPSIATVDGTGNVSGITAGVTTVGFAYTSGCAASKTVTVNPLPAAITGTTVVCVGGTTALADAATGGTWSSSDATIATVGATTGVITGVSEAAATITYTLPTGCFTSTAVMDDCNVGVKQIASAQHNVNIFPNPNKGDFTIAASLNPQTSNNVWVEITDIVGNPVYKGAFTSINGILSEQISLGNAIANGMYLLVLRSGSENTVLHFVIDK